MVPPAATPRAARAGPLDPSAEHKAQVTIRKGNISENPRGGVVQHYTIRVSEGFDVLKAKALSFRTSAEFAGARLVNENVYFKKSKGAAQSQFIALDADNFETQIANRWSLISQGDVSRWEREGKTILEAFVFEFFVYIHRNNRANSVPTGLRRATAARVQEAAATIAAYERENNVELGQITNHHLQIHQARQPQGTPFQMPNDNTTRQAQELDEELRRIRERDADADAEAGLTERNIRLKIQGVWLDVPVDLASLRTALGLPQHNLFHGGIFHEYEHPRLETEDIEDVDHLQDPPPAAGDS